MLIVLLVQHSVKCVNMVGYKSSLGVKILLYDPQIRINKGSTYNGARNKRKNTIEMIFNSLLITQALNKGWGCDHVPPARAKLVFFFLFSSKIGLVPPSGRRGGGGHSGGTTPKRLFWGAKIFPAPQKTAHNSLLQ